MIASLRGRPVANTPEGLVLDVGGVGYLVAATPTAVRKADGAQEVSLHTYLHVREDAARFQAIPGIGKKTAERIVLELKEKLAAGMPEAVASAGGRGPHVVARDALVELGWSVVEAEQALAHTDPDAPPEERVRQALKEAA